MSAKPEPVARPDASDRLGLILTAGAAGLGIVAVLVSAIGRLAQVAPGRDIPVEVDLKDETVPLPLGPGGSHVDGTVDTATVVVADPAPATLFALWAEPIVWGATWIALLVIGAILCVRLARAQVFDRFTYRMLYAASAILTAGWVGGSILTGMTVNGALAAVSEHTYEVQSLSLNLGAVIGVVAIAAVATAVQVGERLRKEMEGLV